MAGPLTSSYNLRSRARRDGRINEAKEESGPSNAPGAGTCYASYANSPFTEFSDANFAEFIAPTTANPPAASPPAANPPAATTSTSNQGGKTSRGRAAPKARAAAKAPAARPAPKASKGKDTLRVRGRNAPAQINKFLGAHPRALHTVRVLSLELREEHHDELFDDKLAIALGRLSGSKSLAEVHLHVEGEWLFTRGVYTLVSPAAAVECREDAQGKVAVVTRSPALLAYSQGTQLSGEDVVGLGVKVHEGVKNVVAALLRLGTDGKTGKRRHLERVKVHGAMEGKLKKELVEGMRGGAQVVDLEREGVGLVAGGTTDLRVISRTTPAFNKAEKAISKMISNSGCVMPLHPGSRVVLGFPVWEEEIEE